MKDEFIQAFKNISEFLETPDDELDTLEQWTMNLAVSLGELQDTSHLARLYEVEKTLSISRNELPLLIGQLKTTHAQELLTKRLKG